MTVRLLLAAVVAVPVLVGCQTDVATRIDVVDAATSTITTTVRFDGDAAAVIAADPALQRDLSDLVAQRAGTDPVVAVAADEVTVTADVAYETLVASSAITGVAAARLDPGDGTATVTVTLTQPDDLVAAVVTEAARGRDQADAAAVASTMLAATTVTVTVAFPGDVTDVTADEPVVPWVVTDTTTVTVAAPADRFPAGQVTVTGSLDGSAGWVPWTAAAAVAAVLAVVVVAARRR